MICDGRTKYTYITDSQHTKITHVYLLTNLYGGTGGVQHVRKATRGRRGREGVENVMLSIGARAKYHIKLNIIHIAIQKLKFFLVCQKLHRVLQSIHHKFIQLETPARLEDSTQLVYEVFAIEIIHAAEL